MGMRWLSSEHVNPAKRTPQSRARLVERLKGVQIPPPPPPMEAGEPCHSGEGRPEQAPPSLAERLARLNAAADDGSHDGSGTTVPVHGTRSTAVQQALEELPLELTEAELVPTAAAAPRDAPARHDPPRAPPPAEPTAGIGVTPAPEPTVRPAPEQGRSALAFLAGFMVALAVGGGAYLWLGGKLPL